MSRLDQVAGFILAGGGSSRMGMDKGLLEIDGVPLIVRTARLVDGVDRMVSAATVVGRPETYQRIGLRAIADNWPGCGPLGGIATALRASDTEWNLIVACDLPYLACEWLQFLSRRARESVADAVVPMSERGSTLPKSIGMRGTLHSPYGFPPRPCCPFSRAARRSRRD